MAWGELGIGGARRQIHLEYGEYGGSAESCGARRIDSRLKAPDLRFSPTDDGDPSEVDAFNAMIRRLRDQDDAE